MRLANKKRDKIMKMGRKKHNSGFTLAEMIVSVALFSIVVTVSTGALLTVLSTNQRAQAIETVMNNLDFALQQMARDIRVGTHYYCGVSPSLTAYGDCSPSPSNSSFSFTSHDGVSRVIYELSGTSILRSVDGGANYYPITASQINVTRLAFYVSGSNPSDNQQPKVFIVLQGNVTVKGAKTNFNLQTTVSQRLLDRN